jgi:hypothetical protein
MKDFIKTHWLAILLVLVLVYALYQVFKTVQAGINALSNAATQAENAILQPFTVAGAFLSWIFGLITGPAAPGSNGAAASPGGPVIPYSNPSLSNAFGLGTGNDTGSEAAQGIYPDPSTQ